MASVCDKCGGKLFWPALGTATGRVELQNTSWKLLDHMHPAKCAKCSNRQLIPYDDITSMPPEEQSP